VTEAPQESEAAGQGPSSGCAADAASTSSKMCNPLSGLPPGPGSAGDHPKISPPPAGRCAGPEADQTPSPQRQRRAQHGRSGVVYVRVTPDEEEAIRTRATAAGVSAPRLLVELAVLGKDGASERRARNRLLLDLRRQVVGIATNLNQLAKWANTREQVPPGLASSLAAAERALEELTAAVEELRS